MKSKIISVITVFGTLFFILTIEKSIIKIKHLIPEENFSKIVGNLHLFIVFLSVSLFLMLIFSLKETLKKPYNEDKLKAPLIRIVENFQRSQKEIKNKKDELEKKLKEVYSTLELILNSEVIGIIVVDNSLRVVFLNETARNLLSLESTSSFLNIKNSKLKEHLDEEFIKSKDKYAYYEKEVSQRTIAFYALKSNDFKRTVFILKDITTIKEAQKLEELKKEQKALREMARFLAHEVKNSSGIILGNLKLLERKYSKEKIKTIKNEVGYLLNSMELYLRLWKPEHLKLEDIELSNILNEIREDFKDIIEIEFNVSYTAKADRELLKSIFKNLIKNSIEAGATEVKISAKKDKNFIIIEYKDNGAGIKEENLQNIFLPFFSTKDKGSGMGLSFVKKFLIDMGGNIEAKSSKSGAYFVLKLKTLS